MIVGILLILIAAIFAFASGVAGCLGLFMGDPVLYNRIASTEYENPALLWLLEKGPQEVCLISAGTALISLWSGLIVLL